MMNSVRAKICVATIAMLWMSTGISHAGLDDELSSVDDQGQTMTVQRWNTVLNSVAPLDRNRLTREWFHSGRAKYFVTGPDASTFEGTLQLGYQISFPWSLGVGIGFNYSTPNILLDDGDFLEPPIGGFDSVITSNFLPGVSISTNLGNGPGLQEIATLSVAVIGAEGEVAVSNAHGTVTGAAGGVLLRPFARLTADTGNSVTTYGAPWDIS